MLTMLALLAAMQPVGMKGHADWITPDDYPRSALQKNEAGYVGFSVLVDPDGKTERCDVTAPSAFSDLNALSCSLVVHRARFTPATGSDGQPTYGLFRSWASWLVAEDRFTMNRLEKLYPRPSGVDLTLFIKAPKLPDPVDLVVNVDASGFIDKCQGKSPSTPGEIVRLSCEQLKSQWKPKSGVTLAGKAVPTVQTATVDFKFDNAANKQP